MDSLWKKSNEKRIDFVRGEGSEQFTGWVKKPVKGIYNSQMICYLSFSRTAATPYLVWFWMKLLARSFFFLLLVSLPSSPCPTSQPLFSLFLSYTTSCTLAAVHTYSLWPKECDLNRFLIETSLLLFLYDVRWMCCCCCAIQLLCSSLLLFIAFECNWGSFLCFFSARKFVSHSLEFSYSLSLLWLKDCWTLKVNAVSDKNEIPIQIIVRCWLWSRQEVPCHRTITQPGEFFSSIFVWNISARAT